MSPALLHVHSNFSFSWGANRMDEVFRGAAERGWRSLAITDINNLCGLHEALRCSKEHGVRLIPGAELRAGTESAAALATSEEGFANLCAAITGCRRTEARLRRRFNREEQVEVLTPRAHRDAPLPAHVSHPAPANSSFIPHPSSLPELLSGRTAGLVFLAPSVETAKALREVGARTYLEIKGNDFPAAAAAAKLGIRPVASRAVTFVAKGDRETHLLLRAIAYNTTLGAVTERGDSAPTAQLSSVSFSPSLRADLAYARAAPTNSSFIHHPSSSVVAPPSSFMPSVRQLDARYAQIPEALESLQDIESECLYEYSPPLPDIPGPELAPAETAARLRELAYKGALRRYGTAEGRVGERMEYELGLISSKNFSGYFLIIKDIVDRFSRTCGRGSGAASLVAYCLGITDVDPIRHNLYFERFLNPGRKDPPDMDVDFAWDERDGAIDYVLEKYGPRRSAMISTHITFGPRMAIRETAKVYGLSDGETGRVTRRLPWFFAMEGDEGDPDPDAGRTALLEEIRSLPQLKGTEFPPPWPEIISRASRIIGYPRHMSVHCGGVVITSGEISSRVPVEAAPKGVPIVQWEKDASEDFGLVKIDLLGNRSLAVIRDAVENIRANGLPFDEDRWDPEGDPATVDLLARGDSIGVFYVESPAMRQLQKKTGKGDFEHLVIHSSIIRPAANAYIREYVRRLRGGAWEPLHPLLDGVLSETFGIMCYQEDVSRAAIALAGFSHEEGDALRKVLSKKDRARRLPDFKARFMAGSERNGVDGATAEKVWEMMESFAGYSFCKPHSASYAKVSFQSAFIKTHHPAEFIAAVISNQGGYYTTFAYVSEAARMGLNVLAPDVNASAKKFTGRGREIRTGLMQVKGLSTRSMDDILLARREGGPFRSLDDFVKRTRIQRPEVESLVLVGATDSVAQGLSRPQLLWKLCALEPRQEQRGKTMELFDETLLNLTPARLRRSLPLSINACPEQGRGGEGQGEVPPLPEYSPARLRGLEFENLGYLCSDHPLRFYLERRPDLRYVKGSKLGAYVGRRIRTVGWLVTGKLVYSKHGEPMEFVSFEDTDAIYETTFFPDAFKIFAHMLDRTRPYILTGKVDEDFGAFSLTVEDVEFM